MESDDQPVDPTPRAGGKDQICATPPILVLGMHRSGTSSVAGMLHLAGAYLGERDELLPPHEQDNPTGYWERADVVAAHHEFLEHVGFGWDAAADFDWNHLDANAREKLRATLQDLIRELQTGARPWLVKDPRLCLLLPAWLEQVPDAACVVVVRDPREIADSLLEGPRGVYTSHFLLALWEKYLRTALRALDGQRVVFVDYDAMLVDPMGQSSRIVSELENLGVAGLRPPSSEAASNFIDKKMKRGKPDNVLPLSVQQESLYAWLRKNCEMPGPVVVCDVPQAAPSDTQLKEFENASRYQFQRGHEVAAAEADVMLRKTGHELAETQQRLRNLAAEQEATQHRERQALADASRLDVHVKQLQRETATLQDQIGTLQHLVGSLQREIGTVQTEREALRATTRNLSALVYALRSSWSWRITAPLRFMLDGLKSVRSFAWEQRAYRLFYALPGFNPARKRAAILWLHGRAPWLTRGTMSYQLYEQSLRLADLRAKSADERLRSQRMDEKRASDTLLQLKRKPTISIVMPVYNVERRWLMEAVQSVRRQFYPHWQLCIADDASTSIGTREALGDIERMADARIKICRLDKNGGIAVASNAALKLADGDYVGLLDHDDVLARDALLEIALRTNADDSDVLYSDEDKLDENGEHVEPHFKPDFNPDYLLSTNYVCHFLVIRRELLAKIGGFRAGFDGAQDYDLVLRATEAANHVAHIPKVLYHWRKTPQSTASVTAAKPKASEAGIRALTDSMQRRAVDGKAEPGPYPTTYRARRAIIGEPLVSILIPFRDKAELLEVCVRSIIAKTDYNNIEIVGIDNESQEDRTHESMDRLQRHDDRIRFVRYEAPFNYSAVNNFGVKHTRGEHLLFLNNDTEVIERGWLRAMLEHSQRPEVGVVGAKLLYSDGRLQHAGVIVGVGGVAGHAHLLQPGDHPGYFSRAQLPQNLSAVTFACAMTRRDVFDRLDGLNEKDLTIAFNDIDYCLRAREAGYWVVYTPYATLFHHESRSRGYEDNPEKQNRFAREIAYMQQRHHAVLTQGDPHYNPRLSLTQVFDPDPRYVDELPL